jgi:DNA-binding CsgD family transcriptional regulator
MSDDGLGPDVGESDLVIFLMQGTASPLLPTILNLIERTPCCPFAILGDPGGTFAKSARRLGAFYIHLPITRDDLIRSVVRALGSEVPCIRSLTARAIRQWSLSPQQARILYFNLWSLSNQEIASLLGVTLHTVQDYQVALRRKTGARSKDGYLRRILEVSGISPPVCDLVTRSLGAPNDLPTCGEI